MGRWYTTFDGEISRWDVTPVPVRLADAATAGGCTDQRWCADERHAHVKYGLTLNQHNELVPHGGRVEEKRQQLEASAEAERLQAFEKLPEAERQQAFREQYPDGTPPARNTVAVFTT